MKSEQEETPMSEQQSEPTTTTVPATESIPSDTWGQPISVERQVELQGYLDRWEAETEHGNRRGPFDSVKLGRADVYWLAEQSGRDEEGRVPNLHLEWANLSTSHLEGADLREAHLEGTNLYLAHLESADLSKAYLEGANLYRAHLEGVDLYQAHLDSAELRRVWLDSKTMFNKTMLNSETSLGDIQWGGVGAVNLTHLDWNQVPTLGDERGLHARSRLADYEAAVRAYRQLAAQLRAQGLSEVADRFSERAQIRQRKLLFRQLLEDWRRPWRLPSDLLRWFFSWFLALLAGYGYHPGRSVLWYLATIFGFAFAFYHLGPTEGVPFSQLGAVVFSVTSFHGRGFFPGGSPGHSLTLDDPVTVLAATEAIIGLLIEISFIATFTQRFFGNK
jgi:hypothetical protein